MTSLWFLTRLQGGETFPLQFGETTLGRDKKSSILTPSVYASRKHCTINVSDKNGIKLTDCKTSNGTYINATKLSNDTVPLFNNDQIGIGCSIDYDGGEDEEIYVFIIKRVVNNLVIEISDDEVEVKKEVLNEIDDKENHKENDENLPKKVGENSNLMKVPEVLEEVVADVPMAPEIPMEEGSDSDIFEFDEDEHQEDEPKGIVEINSDSDDDFAYSQRVNQEIKSELMDMEDVFEDSESDSNESDSKNDSNYINSDDGIILIDSDDDEDSKKGADKWFAILSQSFDHSCAIKNEPVDYVSEEEIGEQVENENNNMLPCVVKLTDVVEPEQKQKTKKTRKLKKSVRDLLKSLTSDSSEEDEKPIIKKEPSKSLFKSITSESSSDEDDSPIPVIRKKKRKSITSDSYSEGDDNLKKQRENAKKIKISDTKQKSKPKEEVKTKRRHSSDEKLQKKTEPRHSSSSDENMSKKTIIQKTEEKPRKITQRRPTLIEPPHLPSGRGIHRGISIDTSEKMMKRARITSRRPTLTFRPDDLAAKHEKEKTAEMRKTKLRELAEAKAEAKKQLKLQDDEAKVVNTPKVKLTLANRGAFLTETIPKPSSRITIKVPSRSEVASLPKIPRIQRKSESEEPVPVPLQIHVPVPVVPVPASVQEELFTIDVPKKSNLIKDGYPKNSIKKKVTFNDTPQIKTYQIDEGNVLSNRQIPKDAPTTKSMQPSRIEHEKKCTKKEKDPNKHKFQDVLTQVTEWPPEWFGEKFINASSSPPVNGTKHTLLPMIHEFKSSGDYEKILLPLMKLELWSSIKSESVLNQNWTVSEINNIRSEIRGPGTAQRSLYGCSVKANSFLRIGSIVLVKFKSSQRFHCFLAYISESKHFSANNNLFRQLTLETSRKNAHEGLFIGKQFSFRNIGYIRAELNSFTAVYDLKFSPLYKLVLDPVRNFKQLSAENQAKQYTNKACDKLNEAQETILMDVYKKCVDKKMPSISLIEGPAGTGKSILITNLILQLIFGREVQSNGRGLKIMFCAPSNAAVDIVTYKLSVIRQNMDKKQRFKMIRFGIDEKINPNVQKYSLKSFVEHTLATNNLSKEDRVKMENEKLHLEAKLLSLQTPESSNNVSRVQIDELVNDIKRINGLLSNKSSSSRKEKDAGKSILENADIVCTTLSSCTNLLLYNVNAFDVCIVDEATQCTEPMSIMPLQYGISKLILVGDTQQLPATIMSKEAKENKFESSLFSRIQSCFSEHSHDIVHKLCVQYRMHPEICRFPNKYFYKNTLKTGLKVDAYDSFPIKPYSVFSLTDFTQSDSDLNSGCSNINEADFVVCVIQELFKTIPKPEKYSFAVITPYNKQKTEIESKIFSLGAFPITVNTIDSYQGQEKDIVIISTTRTKGVGFMSSAQRLNVAITRAKRCLIICGNFVSLQTTHIWSSLIKDATERNLLYNVSKDDVQNGKRIMSCVKK